MVKVGPEPHITKIFIYSIFIWQCTSLEREGKIAACIVPGPSVPQINMVVKGTVTKVLRFYAS